MNRDLVTTLYDMLNYYIEKNENEIKEYNELKAKGTSISYLNAFKIRMQKTVDNFYILKPYYIEYNENPTKELEEEIIDKFKPLILEYYNFLKESKKKENLKVEKEIEEEEINKKEFPILENSNSNYDFSRFLEPEIEENIHINQKLETKNKSLVDRLKEKLIFDKHNSSNKRLSIA